jgi:Transmembrane domain of unknown function (DUF3566)
MTQSPYVGQAKPAATSPSPPDESAGWHPTSAGNRDSARPQPGGAARTNGAEDASGWGPTKTVGSDSSDRTVDRASLGSRSGSPASGGPNGPRSSAFSTSASASTVAAPPAPPAPAGPAAGSGSASRPASADTSASGSAAPQPPRRPATSGPRRARLQLRHINPWTVLKFSCVLSIALFFVWLITIGVLYGVLQAAGVVNTINDAVQRINGPGSAAPITPGVVFGGAALIGAVNIVLFIALSTIGSVVYNLCADLVGGIELTLSERE